MSVKVVLSYSATMLFMVIFLLILIGDGHREFQRALFYLGMGVGFSSLPLRARNDD